MKIIKISALAVLCIFLAVCIYGIIQMQINFPNPVMNTYAVGEEFSFGSYEFKVTGTKRWYLEDFCEEYGVTNHDEKYMEERNTWMCLVSIEVKNIGDQPVKPDIGQIVIGTPIHSTGFDLFFLRKMNNGSSQMILPTLQPNESISIDLPYTYSGINYGYDEGDFLDKIDLELTLTLYPVKRVVKLNENIDD